jgi:hypothetical protein
VQGALDLKNIGKKIEKSGKWKNFGKITKKEKNHNKKINAFFSRINIFLVIFFDFIIQPFFVKFLFF